MPVVFDSSVAQLLCGSLTADFWLIRLMVFHHVYKMIKNTSITKTITA